MDYTSMLILTEVIICSVLVDAINDDVLRVIGGHKDTESQYPWVVFMIKNGSGKCTGSLISPVWVLSAAHCSEAGDRVYLYENGQSFSLKLIEQMQNGKVVLIIPHEMASSYRHDIGLYKVTAITIPKYGKLSAIDYKSLAGREVAVMGFGVERFYSPNKDESLTNTLEWKNSLNVANGMITQCDQSDIINKLAASEPTICIVRPCGEVGLLGPGDSGGPVVYDGAIVGVNSYIYDLYMSRAFIPRATVSVHSVYAVPISIYLDWISKTLMDNKYN